MNAPRHDMRRRLRPDEIAFLHESARAARAARAAGARTTALDVRQRSRQIDRGSPQRYYITSPFWRQS